VAYRDIVLGDGADIYVEFSGDQSVFINLGSRPGWWMPYLNTGVARGGHSGFETGWTASDGQQTGLLTFGQPFGYQQVGTYSLTNMTLDGSWWVMGSAEVPGTSTIINASLATSTSVQFSMAQNGLFVYAGHAGSAGSTGVTVVQDSWNHVAITQTLTTATYYLNGAQIATSPNTFGSFADMFITCGAPNGFAMVLGPVAAYSSVLTTGQISNHAASVAGWPAPKRVQQLQKAC
jgi:hypothetical protein